MSVNNYFAICVIMIVTAVFNLCSGQYVIQTFTGTIGSGNFTYYRLSREGDLSIVLDTLKGDADIYISQTNMNPDYDDYDLKAASCGQDRVEIPKDFKRPIGVGVYGHVYFFSSDYRLSVVLDYATDSSNQWDQVQHKGHSDSEEDNILWTIFVNILKILFDILV
ncbi:UPF0669 protein v1g209471-like [Glandiceps talaboti]